MSTYQCPLLHKQIHHMVPKSAAMPHSRSLCYDWSHHPPLLPTAPHKVRKNVLVHFWSINHPDNGYSQGPPCRGHTDSNRWGVARDSYSWADLGGNGAIAPFLFLIGHLPSLAPGSLISSRFTLARLGPCVRWRKLWARRVSILRVCSHGVLTPCLLFRPYCRRFMPVKKLQCQKQCQV